MWEKRHSHSVSGKESLCMCPGHLQSSVDEEGRHKEWQLRVQQPSIHGSLQRPFVPLPTQLWTDEWVSSQLPVGWAGRNLTSISGSHHLSLNSGPKLWRWLTELKSMYSLFEFPTKTVFYPIPSNLRISLVMCIARPGIVYSNHWWSCIDIKSL